MRKIEHQHFDIMDASAIRMDKEENPDIQVVLILEVDNVDVVWDLNYNYCDTRHLVEKQDVRHFILDEVIFHGDIVHCRFIVSNTGVSANKGTFVDYDSNYIYDAD